MNTTASRKGFLVWKQKHQPLNPNTLESRGWQNATATLDEAREAISADPSLQVGINFAHQPNLGGLDLDNCRNPETGELSDWVKPILSYFKGKAYADISVSKTGIKLIFKVANSAHAFKVFYGEKLEGDFHAPQADFFFGASGRYFALTSSKVEGFRCVGEWVNSEAMAYHLDELPAIPFEDIKQVTGYTGNQAPADTEANPSLGFDLTDAEASEFIRELVAARPELVEHYETWRDIVFAIAYQFEGSKEGLEFADEVSSGASSYQSYCKVEETYSTSKGGGSRLIKPRTLMNRSEDFTNPEWHVKGLSTPTLERVGSRIGEAEMALRLKGVSEMRVAEYIAEKLSKEFVQLEGDSLIQHYSKDTKLGILRPVGSSNVAKGKQSKLRSRAGSLFATLLEESRAKEQEGRHPLQDFENIRTRNSAVNLAPELTTIWQESEIGFGEYEINLPNGVYNLKTGNFREREPGEFGFKVSDTDYLEGAKAPQAWLDHLNDTLQDSETVRYLQTILGSTLLSGNPTGVACWLVGVGGSGKSVISKVIAGVLGDGSTGYSTALDISAMKETDNTKGEQRRARLKKKRLAIVNEASDDISLDIYKRTIDATGGEVDARGMYEDHENVSVEATFLCLTNSLPVNLANCQDDAIRRRTAIFNFESPILRQDPKFVDKILAERAGILNWLIEGAKTCLISVAEGETLKQPKTCLEAFRDEGSGNSFINFLREGIVYEAGAELTLVDLKEAYVKQGNAPLKNRMYANLITSETNSSDRNIEYLSRRAVDERSDLRSKRAAILYNAKLKPMA